jgi:hypothetical protein
MSFSIRSVAGVAIAAFATIALATSAEAGQGLTFELSIDGGAPIIFEPAGSDVGGGVFNYQGEQLDPSWALSWDLNAKADPFVSGNIVFQNLSILSPVSVSLLITLPVTAVTPSSLIGGSVAGGLTTDLGGGQITDNGGPVWEALIDNAVVATLLDDPFAVSVVGAGSAAIGPEAFGQPIPNMPGPAALTSIGIRLNFVLGASDSASFTSVFVVEAIPGPAGLALLGFAGMIGGRRRRA